MHDNLVSIQKTRNIAKQHADLRRHFTRVEYWNCYLELQEVVQHYSYCFTALDEKILLKAWQTISWTTNIIRGYHNSRV